MSKYSIGRSYEYRAKKQLELDGYQVIRSAGSHGDFDLIAFKDDAGKDDPVRCIQVKRTTSERGLKQLMRAFKSTGNGGGTHWATELWVWYKGKWYITGGGVK